MIFFYMQEKFQELKERAQEEVQKIFDPKLLREWEIKYLGRKGELARLFGEFKNLSQKLRPELGRLANEIKITLEQELTKKRSELENELNKLEEKELIDVTAPGLNPPEGHLHLVTTAIREITEIFTQIGFRRVRYPEVEKDWYTFEALNMPPDHPARDEWETFFITPKVVLTPHATSGDVREMEKKKLPIRMINISKCYRRQSDVSHVPMFHQFDGLYIDKDVTISHLKGVFDYFVKNFFGGGRKIRFRPFHFRFTEPSFEVDINCGVCLGEGCRFCKGGWHELGGAGMIHPNVLRAGKINAKKYQGFAFGWGVERTYMMKSGLKIDDIRLLYKNDLRFLEQF